MHFRIIQFLAPVLLSQNLKQVENASQARRKGEEVCKIVSFISQQGLTTEAALKEGYGMKSVFARIAQQNLKPEDWKHKSIRKNETKRVHRLLARHVYDAVFGEKYNNMCTKLLFLSITMIV